MIFSGSKHVLPCVWIIFFLELLAHTFDVPYTARGLPLSLPNYRSYSSSSVIVSHLRLSLCAQAMALVTSISGTPLSVSIPIRRTFHNRQCFSYPYASLSPSPSSESKSPTPPNKPTLPPTTSSSNPFGVEPSRPSDSGLNYALANPNGSLVVRFLRSTESTIERVSNLTILASSLRFN